MNHLHLAADMIRGTETTVLNRKVAILTDSKAALLMLGRPHHSCLAVQSLAHKLHSLRAKGLTIHLQWIPAHVCIRGNEEADCLAKSAHHPSTSMSEVIRPLDAARHLIRRDLQAMHPDPRVASGKPPCPLPSRGLARADRALLLGLRIGCHRCAERKHRLGIACSPSCPHCPAIETLAHALCEFPEHAQARTVLKTSYGKLRLPSSTPSNLLFPDCRLSLRESAFRAILNFLKDTGLSDRL